MALSTIHSSDVSDVAAHDGTVLHTPVTLTAVCDTAQRRCAVCCRQSQLEFRELSAIHLYTDIILTVKLQTWRIW